MPPPRLYTNADLQSIEDPAARRGRLYTNMDLGRGVVQEPPSGQGRLYTNADLPGEIPSLGFTPPEYAPSTEEILGSWGYPKYGDPPPTLPTSAPTQEENDIAGVAPSIAPPEPSISATPLLPPELRSWYNRSQSPSYPPWEPPTPSAPSARYPSWEPPASLPRMYSEGPDIHRAPRDGGIIRPVPAAGMGTTLAERFWGFDPAASMRRDQLEQEAAKAAQAPPPTSKLPASEAGPAAGAGPTPPPSEPMRAVRLPNGKLVFTNTADHQGEEMSPAAAGDIVRGQNQGMLGGSPPPPLSEYASPANEPKFRSYPAMDRTGETMRGLVLAAARASMAKDRPVQTAVSQIQTPPGQIPESALQDALRAMALAESQNVIRTARMSPEARTRALSPAVQAPAATFDLGRPIIERIRAQQASDLLGASKIPDKAMKDAEIERINTKANQDITDILMLLKSSGISSAWGPGGVYGQ